MTAQAVPSFVQRHHIPVAPIGGLPIAVMDRVTSAELMVCAALASRGSGRAPLLMTSANGQVLSLCARNKDVRDQFLSTDLIHADGMPLVFASRLKGKAPLPERVATTDLFHDVAELAEPSGVRFFLLGANDDVIAEATRKVRETYPALEIAGVRSGYFEPDEEERVMEEINASGADILWVGMGVPRELVFSLRCRSRLTNVGVIKTSGGLFDFLSGRNSRAPQWMQGAGLEWLYRLGLEPRRLFWRYATTNIHATYLLLAPTPFAFEQHHADKA